jgi:hypothetical protein
VATKSKMMRIKSPLKLSHLARLSRKRTPRLNLAIMAPR